MKKEDQEERQLAIIRKGKAYFDKHKDEIIAKYDGENIAIIDDEIVDHDKEFSNLAKRVYEKYGYRTIYMPLIGKEKFIIHSPSVRVLNETDLGYYLQRPNIYPLSYIKRSDLAKDILRIMYDRLKIPNPDNSNINRLNLISYITESKSSLPQNIEALCNLYAADLIEIRKDELILLTRGALFCKNFLKYD
jgi:hypothetical protein